MRRSRCLAFALALALAIAGPDARAQASAAMSAADSAFAIGDWKAAAALYERTLAEAPGDLGARVKAGYTALALDANAAARTHFQAVVTAAPVNGAPVAQAGLAMALARLGQRQEALERLEAAASAGYANTDAIDRERGFRALRSNPRFVAARHRAEVNAFPCMSDSAARSFDFWIGDWDVYANGTNLRVGHNRIERVSGGCAILENWTARVTPLSGPSDGKSLNFIEPGTGMWRQVWMGSGRGQNNYEQGRYVDGAMRFAWQRRDAQGNQLQGRFTFFNLGPNRVRQLQESTRDGGQSYQTVYDFIYVRRGSGEPPVPPR